MTARTSYPLRESVRIRRYSGPHFPVFGLSNSKYGHLICSDGQADRERLHEGRP